LWIWISNYSSTFIEKSNLSPRSKVNSPYMY
jgi:hypothetical protein